MVEDVVFDLPHKGTTSHEVATDEGDEAVEFVVVAIATMGSIVHDVESDGGLYKS